jgi:hypothetical protein
VQQEFTPQPPHICPYYIPFMQNMSKEKQHSDLTTKQGFHNRIPDHEERSGRLF